MVDKPMSVGDYRIDRLEKEVENVKSALKVLSFDQLQQMAKWIGIPVLVMTGGFGAALWTVLERTTITAAERRAEGKVNELTARIEELEVQAAEVQGKSELALQSLSVMTGRADEAAISVSRRAAEAGQRVLEAEQELGKLKSTIAAADVLQKALVETDSIADSLASNTDFQQAIGQIAFRDLEGIVVTFDREAGCPAGWSALRKAAGRVVVGVGVAPGLSPRGWNDQGGKEAFKLSIDQMPQHGHRIATDNKSSNIHDGLAGNSLPDGSDKGILRTFKVVDDKPGWPAVLPDVLEKTGGEASIDNMPPYLALFMCKKE